MAPDPSPGVDSTLELPLVLRLSSCRIIWYIEGQKKGGWLAGRTNGLDGISRTGPSMSAAESRRDASRAEAAQFPESLDQATVEDPPAWELIDSDLGRYMPRRIRGSFRGRALG